MGKEYGGWNWQMMSRKYEDGEMRKKIGEWGMICIYATKVDWEWLGLTWNVVHCLVDLVMLSFAARIEWYIDWAFKVVNMDIPRKKHIRPFETGIPNN